MRKVKNQQGRLKAKILRTNSKIWVDVINIPDKSIATAPSSEKVQKDRVTKPKISRMSGKFKKEESSSDDENSIEDRDTCDSAEISATFSTRYVLNEEAISMQKSYVLSLACDLEFSKLAAGTTNNTVQLFDITNSQLSRKEEINVCSANKNDLVCGVQFSKENPNNLFIGTNDGTIRVYDLRENGEIFQLSDHIKHRMRKIPINCFDNNSNGRIICAGSSQLVETIFLLFFDMRQRKSLGGYSDSHQDDVTDVKFHPTNPDLLISGSTDGLINIFDISQKQEDDALSVVINSESSVDKIQWHTNSYSKDSISCITHTNDLKLYESKEGDLISEYLRSDITSAMKRSSVWDCNLINCHDANDGSTFLLAGSNYHKGEILRSVTVNKEGLKPFANYLDNKQIVRNSIYNPKTNILVTGGECSIVTVWSNTKLESLPSGNLKVKSELREKIHKQKPY